MSDKTELVALLRSSGWKIAAKKAEELFREMMRADNVDTKFSAEEVKVEMKARQKTREFISDWFESIFNTAFEPDVLTEEEKDVFVRVSEN